MSATRFAWLALTTLAAVVVAGCIGAYGRPDPPPKPTRVIVPEIVGLAVESKSGECSSVVIALDSGEVVTKFRENLANNCGKQPTPVFLGQASGENTRDGVDPIVLAGTVDGVTWIGSAPWDSNRKGWCVIFGDGEGAHREEAGFHLASGLLLPVAADFHWLSIDESDLLPLRDDDDFCLNERGEVVAINVWNSY